MTSDTGQKIAYLICFAVVALTITGYFIGLQSPMNPGDHPVQASPLQSALPTASMSESDVLPATDYSGMGKVTRVRTAGFTTKLADLKTSVNLLDEITISPEQKSFALALRDTNRAFNGAPPTTPHPVDQLSAKSCMACHGEGIKTESFRASKMSHQFLENCTQCHVENDPKHMPATLFRSNSFVGLPAPTGGPRAFDTAPPMIPHSTWMRVDCMSCHGVEGLHGIRSTHPWRSNCQQCHAPSSVLDQVELNPKPKFLPPPVIKD